MCDQDTVRIPLYARGVFTGSYALVDAADAEWANQWRWHLHSKGYASRTEHRNGRSRMFLMHRELLGLQHGDRREGDHIDRDRLNCRRSNLRIVPPKANQQNTPSKVGSSSMHRGVYRRGHKWAAVITVNRKGMHLGTFDTEERAAEAARAARQRLLPYSQD